MNTSIWFIAAVVSIASCGGSAGLTLESDSSNDAGSSSDASARPGDATSPGDTATADAADVTTGESDGAESCNAGDGAEGCTHDLPSMCPPVVPSYKSDIASIVARRCSPCHFPGGVEVSVLDMSTYGGVVNAESAIVNQVAMCLMPPTEGIPSRAVQPAPNLCDSERVALLAWLVCGAPNN